MRLAHSTLLSTPTHWGSGLRHTPVSFSIVVSEMLMGRFPFDDVTQAESVLFLAVVCSDDCKNKMLWSYDYYRTCCSFHIISIRWNFGRLL